MASRFKQLRYLVLDVGSQEPAYVSGSYEA